MIIFFHKRSSHFYLANYKTDPALKIHAQHHNDTAKELNKSSNVRPGTKRGGTRELGPLKAGTPREEAMGK